MDAALREMDGDFREVTVDEIAHYQQHGWVKLARFIPMGHIESLLAYAKENMGEKGDRNAPPKAFAYFNPLTIRGLDKPIFDPVIRHVGRNARALMARKTDVGVRYFTDFYNVKLPQDDSNETGGQGKSDWHQDYAAAASDRSGGMVFWIALDHLLPEKGTMAFLNGSHRFGAMGHFTTYGKDNNLIDSYPELLDSCSSSGEQTYEPGDVTVHSNLTVHAAGINITTGPRWTYTVIVNPADACWTGGPADAFDTAGLQYLKPMDDVRFPVIG